jgi:hypothetical protein
MGSRNRDCRKMRVKANALDTSKLSSPSHTATMRSAKFNTRDFRSRSTLACMGHTSQIPSNCRPDGFAESPPASGFSCVCLIFVSIRLYPRQQLRYADTKSL